MHGVFADIASLGIFFIGHGSVGGIRAADSGEYRNDVRIRMAESPWAVPSCDAALFNSSEPRWHSCDFLRLC